MIGGTGFRQTTGNLEVRGWGQPVSDFGPIFGF